MTTLYTLPLTYLESSQTHGDSSVKMYNDIARERRLVELVCWDGKVWLDYIATHCWHFLVDNLDFEVVLKSIKEYVCF
jgi:hypothetical protein